MKIRILFIAGKLFALMGPLAFCPSCKELPSPAESLAMDAVAEHLFEEFHTLYSPDCLVPVGATVATKEVRNIANASMEISVQDQPLKGVMSKRYEHAYLSKYLSDTIIRTQYQVDQVSGRAIINGKPAPQPNETLSLHDKTIIFKSSVDGWKGSLKDAEPTPEQMQRIEDLARQINATNHRVIFGEIPRKVGDSWDIEAPKLQFYMGSLREMQGVLKVQFQSLRKYQGHDCAVIVTRFNLIGEEPEGMEMQLTGRAVTLIALDCLLPLSVEMAGQIMMDNPIMEGRGRMRVKGAIEVSRESTLKVPEKP